MKYIFMITLLLLGSALASQSTSLLHDFGNGTYSDGTSIKKLHEFRFLFKDTDGLKSFGAFDRARKTQRIVNYSTLGIVGLTGVALLAQLAEANDTSALLKEGTAIFGLGLAGLVAATGNLFAGTLKGVHKRKLLEQYGGLELTSIDEKPATLVLSIKATGVVLTYVF